MKAILTILAAVVLFLGVGLGYWYWQGRSHAAVNFRTAAVERGSLWATISATGTVEPEELVDVGAQVAGRIQYFGPDPRDTSNVPGFCASTVALVGSPSGPRAFLAAFALVAGRIQGSRPIDYGSVVDEDTVLLQLDDALFRAGFAEAKANVQRAEADLDLTQAKLRQTERDWERVQRLGPQGAVSGLDYDTIRFNYEGAAAAGVSAANVAQAKAVLQKADINLGYTTIKSPVKGTIIDRRVNVGQTVVASLNAPSLFLIAKDLTRMQVWAAVNEADIAGIHTGQSVRFKVDARPYEEFTGQVAQIRLNATMTQNVVIYTVVVNTDNSHGKLLPYQTANLQFDVTRREDVLLVPNSALRWKPQVQLVAADARAVYARSLRRKAAVAAGRSSEEDRQDQAFAWIEEAGLVRPILVRTGITDGTMTEIVAGDLEEGMAVVVGEGSTNGHDQTQSPFTPQFNRKQQ